MKKSIAILFILAFGKIAICQNWYEATGSVKTVRNHNVHFFNPDTGFAIMVTIDEKTNGIYQTFNGGKSWKILASYADGFRYNTNSIMLNDSVIIYASIYPKPYLISTNRGKSWDTLFNSLNSRSNAFSFFDGKLLSHDSTGRVQISLDYGRSWSAMKGYEVGPIDYRRANLKVYNDSILYAFHFNPGEDSMVTKSTDLGKTWQPIYLLRDLGKGLNSDHFDVLNEDTFYWFGGIQNGLYWSNDEGKTWDSIPHDLPDGLYFTDVKFADKDTGYAIVGLYDIYKTCNGGKNWVHIYRTSCEQVTIRIIDAQNVFTYMYDKNYQACITKTRNGGGDFCTTVSTEFMGEVPYLKVYPNPSNGQVNIKWNQNFKPQQLSLYNAKGQLVFSQASPVQGNFKLENLSTGVYLLKLSNAQEVRTEHVVFE